MPRQPLTEEERKAVGERFRAGREKADAERAAGLRPPKKNRRAAELAAETVRPPLAAPIDLTQTPEFKAALQQAVRDAVADLLPRAPAAEPSGRDTLEKLTDKLAIAIGEYANQNSGQMLVSAEVLAERKEADIKMRLAIEACCIAVRRAQETDDQEARAAAMPHYRLVGKIIAPLMFGDELIEPMRRGADNLIHPTELDWLLPPSLAMVPLNEPAREIFALFKASIGNQKSVRVSGISGKGAAAEPVFAANANEAGFLTNQGHVVMSTSASVQKFNGGPEQAGNAGLDRGLARIRGQEVMRQHSGPPTIQVRTLGTIAPPAVQNG